MGKILAVLILILLVAGFGLTYSRWEFQPPAISFDREFESLGRAPSLTIHVEDSSNPLKQVTVRLVQKDQDVLLVDEAPAGELRRTYDFGTLLAEKYKTQEGPASIVVTAQDTSLGNFFRGNRAELTKEFTFDTSPPRLEVLSGQHYINQGGAECVVYRVSPDASTSGVRVGSHFFPGFPLNPSDPAVRFALFAFSYDLPATTTAQVIARDAAGNETVAGFWQKVFPKRARERDIVIEDSFLQKVVPEILSNTSSIEDQGDLVNTFVAINSKLRKENHETIATLAQQSAGQFLWQGGFLQLSNSQVESLFADRRTYLYQGKPIDQQDHVGFDLSVVQHYPIEAANDGKVVLAEYFGIYGNTVLIDHGAGLISLYGHMSSIDVKPGDMVRKKQVLGRSGATGLAGGDHLHFGLFLQGVPINPTEWWDEKWIREHVLDRMKV